MACSVNFGGQFAGACKARANLNNLALDGLGSLGIGLYDGCRIAVVSEKEISAGQSRGSLTISSDQMVDRVAGWWHLPSCARCLLVTPQQGRLLSGVFAAIMGVAFCEICIRNAGYTDVVPLLGRVGYDFLLS